MFKKDDRVKGIDWCSDCGVGTVLGNHRDYVIVKFDKAFGSYSDTVEL